MWLSYIQFEVSNNTSDAKTLARNVFQRASQSMKNSGEKEERVKLLHAWKAFENEHGDEKTQEMVAKLMPKKIKKRVHYVSEDGVRKKFFPTLTVVIFF